MAQQSYHEEILGGKDYRCRLPMERLKKVDLPTTRITDNVPRFDEREHGFNRAYLGKLGPLTQKEEARFCEKYPISSAMCEMAAYLKPIANGEVAPNEAPIPQDPELLSRHIKSLGYFLRADIVGICRLPQWAVYSYNLEGHQIELNHKFAIVIVIDQDYRTMNGSTGDDWISSSQSFLSYTTSAFIACTMAAYIRRLGYPARAHFEAATRSAYQVAVTPLLLLAGIGEICRAGIVLNPFLGTRFKAAAVTTDLPLLPDKPVDFGLQEFCRKCLKCAVECPANAISKGDKTMYNGYEIWRFDVERCTKHRVINQHGSSCGRCIKVCPWNKPEGWTHDVVRWMVQHAPLLDKFMVKMDGVWGYGKQDKRYKWWFDLEEVDGVIQIPDKRR